jgi:hypothetical protein
MRNSLRHGPEKLSQARDRLEKAEEEWLALEIRREEIESSG